MADYSTWSAIVPIVIVTSLVSSWLTSRQRAQLDKELRRLLAEKYPGVQVANLDMHSLSVRWQGRLLKLPAPPFLKEFGRGRKSNLAAMLEAELIKASGSTAEQLAAVPDTKPLDVGNVQFDKADFGTASAAASRCALCSREILLDYFEVNGEASCAECKDALIARLQKGSDWRHAPRALLYGSGAAAVGCLIYYGIMAMTGYELGLVAIVVGLLVGGAVRKASLGRGGWVYQSIAMTLTYAAIVFTYTPYLITAFRDNAAKSTALNQETVAKAAVQRQPGYAYFVDADGDVVRQALPKKDRPSPSAPEKIAKVGIKKDPNYAYTVNPQGDVVRFKINAASGTAMTAIEAKAPLTVPAVPASASGSPKPGGVTLMDRLSHLPYVIRILVTLAIMVGFIFAVPFLAGVQNVMGLFIIGLALYEAWKLNKRPPLAVAGPFRLGAPVPE